MSDLRCRLIRLAYEKPELRDDLLPLVRTSAVDRERWYAGITLSPGSLGETFKALSVPLNAEYVSSKGDRNVEKKLNALDGVWATEPKRWTSKHLRDLKTLLPLDKYRKWVEAWQVLYGS